MTGNKRYNKLQKGPIRYKKVQKGTERYKKVQKGIKRYKNIQKGIKSDIVKIILKNFAKNWASSRKQFLVIENL